MVRGNYRIDRVIDTPASYRFVASAEFEAYGGLDIERLVSELTTEIQRRINEAVEKTYAVD